MPGYILGKMEEGYGRIAQYNILLGFDTSLVNVRKSHDAFIMKEIESERFR